MNEGSSLTFDKAIQLEIGNVRIQEHPKNTNRCNKIRVINVSFLSLPFFFLFLLNCFSNPRSSAPTKPSQATGSLKYWVAVQIFVYADCGYYVSLTQCRITFANRVVKSACPIAWRIRIDINKRQQEKNEKHGDSE
jgi:hypothetical protein